MADFYNFLIVVNLYISRFTKYYLEHFFCLIRIITNEILDNSEKNHKVFTDMVKNNQLSREKIETYNIIQKNKCIYKYLGLKIDEKFFNNLESIILFIGYSRSGHSLVGSLLDAHPEILVSHELHVVKHLMSGKSKDDILRSMAINSALFNKNGREYTGYDYSIKGQFQGKVKTLKVIGDKKGNGTIRLIRRYPDIVSLFVKFQVPVKLIHVIRNPYDNISTRAKRNNTSLSYSAKGYFRNMETISKLEKNPSFETHHVFLEDLIFQPSETLKKLLTYLKLKNQTESYIEACKARLFSNPKETRFDFEWSSKDYNYVKNKIKEYEFLKRYHNRSFSRKSSKIG